jgi:hypothetical protein
LKATPGDTAAVQVIQSGNFALAFRGGAFLPAVADPQVIFGQDTSHARAHLFHEQGLEEVLATPQIKEGRGLCAFFGASVKLGPDEAETFTSLYGYSPSLSSVQSRVPGLMGPGYVDQKLKEARQLTTDLTAVIRTESASPNFDGYSRQTFLDNVLRGGYPLVLGDNTSPMFMRVSMVISNEITIILFCHRNTIPRGMAITAMLIRTGAMMYFSSPGRVNSISACS